MRRIALAAHHSQRSSVRRILLATNRSTSVSVVEDIAAMCTTAATLSAYRPSHSDKLSGRTRSYRRAAAMLRHLSPDHKRSEITTRKPNSAKSQTIRDPINPAPPVTTITSSADKHLMHGMAHSLKQNWVGPSRPGEITARRQ